ncbi:hypothetical protein [Streptomyces morookaense]|uniref:Uncharacterized protein n=1 Tax=Streptomyces morookaense TaxID=1970 RepID=A0A7Y7B1K7_STRMO|nr:hypothetical protein [Streptomyces morookaense]NVK77154.1 hypothetical protein [Streptomyces morookaense]GHF17113.1 hypothetical protein GCM10010359_18320 [Streptomyces morookaense]
MNHSAQQDSRSEATRLLCAGTYLDIDFRRRVIEELVEHEERPIAPSLGVDIVPVLTHALRARAQDITTALLLLGLWLVFVLVDAATYGAPVWAAAYAGVCFLHWGVQAAAGRGSSVYVVDRRTLRQALKGSGALRALRAALPVLPPLVSLGYWVLALGALVLGAGDWVAVIFPLLLVLPVWNHRTRVAAVMRNELGRQHFARQPRAFPASTYHRRIADAIAREQYAGLTIYDPSRPFIGMGRPYEPWSFALELKRGKHMAGENGAAPFTGPFTGRLVVDLIRPRLEALREAAAATSRDRLKDLEIDEFVYLPVGPQRFAVDYTDLTVRRHLDDSVDEGGEGRRYFLRVRIGAWDEQVVVSVLVRVHTQGGMLVLEVVPHVLTPIRPEFRAVDVIAGRGEEDLLRDGLRALLSAPAAGFAAAVSALRSAVCGFRTWLHDPQRAVPDGPADSVRELAGVQRVSLFQEMDISRYVKTVQDRIASGVREALRSQGYQTDQFEQQIVQISEGGTYIGSMSGGAVAVGAGAEATSTAGSGGR